MELLLKVGIQIEHAADNPRYSLQNQENPPANGNIQYKAKCIERNQANNYADYSCYSFCLSPSIHNAFSLLSDIGA